MRCVICLKNRAVNFICPYCMNSVKHVLRPIQMNVGKEITEGFKSLPLNKQWQVIDLTNKRIGKTLKAGLASELFLGALISEYTQMIILRHSELEIPMRITHDDIYIRRYSQYKSKKGEVI